VRVGEHRSLRLTGGRAGRDLEIADVAGRTQVGQPGRDRRAAVGLRPLVPQATGDPGVTRWYGAQPYRGRVGGRGGSGENAGASGRSHESPRRASETYGTRFPAR